jgi:hypothetical protein
MDTEYLLVTVNPNLPVSVFITPSSNPVVPGSEVEFIASVINGGESPAFQWKLNGANITGATGESLIFTPTDNDEVACILTSNATCTIGNPATSNTITMSVPDIPENASVSGTLANGQTACYDATATLTVAGNTSSFTVQAGGNATLVAGQNIIFLPGTKVLSEGYLHGFITTNNEYCIQPAMPSTAGNTLSGNNIDDIMRPSFKIFPNPASVYFTIEVSGWFDDGAYSVEIFTTCGERVFTEELIRDRVHICSIPDLPAGCYIVKVVAGKFVDSIKLIRTLE